MNFKLEAVDGHSRVGRLMTSHGEIETPVFMPVGTQGSVKTMANRDLDAIGAQIMLANTYHLYLRPGHHLIKRLGGLHKFMNRQRAILTDSGGYQVFSLSKLNRISEEGVLFQSHLDGSRHMITPEVSMEIQKCLGSDIVMAFDECPPLPTDRRSLKESMERTLRWAARCRNYSLAANQQLFGIIQGGLDRDLRQECLERLNAMDFAGLALGGLSVGEKNEEMLSFLEDFVPTMPENRPRYLMGVGTPLDILNGIKSGLDMFDCVIPTRNARNGQLFTFQGPINIKKEEFKEDEIPPVPGCLCLLCANHSRAYLRHLWMSGEYLAGQLITYHNLWFYLELTRNARKAILERKFDEFYKRFYKEYTS